MTKPMFTELLHGQNTSIDPKTVEMKTLAEMYVDMGIGRMPDCTQEDFFAVVAHPFLINEIPPAHLLDSFSEDQQVYLFREVQSPIGIGSENGDPAILSLGRQVGRVLGSSAAMSARELSDSPVNIGDDVLEVDQKQVRHNISAADGPGLVIDMGMGINGMFWHAQNVKRERYVVAAIQRGAGEVAVLHGLRDYNNIPDARMSIYAGGIAANVDRILAAGDTEQADLLIASRVHMAGDDLRYGMNYSEELLRPGGLLVARGPRKAPGVIGYDEVLDIIEDDGDYDIISNYTFVTHSSQGDIEANRSFIAQKVG
jgi:hypothetical protein